MSFEMHYSSHKDEQPINLGFMYNYQQLQSCKVEPVARCHYYFRYFKVKAQKFVRKVLEKNKMLSLACYKAQSISSPFSKCHISLFSILWFFHLFVYTFPLCALFFVATLHVYQQVVSMNNMIYISFAGIIMLPLPHCSAEAQMLRVLQEFFYFYIFP